KNVRFLWSKDCQVAFEQIKKEICSPKILVHYDPSLPLTLASDASPVGIGCVLSHVYPDGSERPIAFASRTLSGSEKNTPKLIKEALSIVWADGVLTRIIDIQGTLVRRRNSQIRQNSGRYFPKDRNKGDFIFRTRMPSTDVAFQIYHSLQLKRLTRDESPPVPEQAISLGVPGRIRARPPERLVVL
ncbi:uncharacterized protein K02A2.6, partial [Trichonephila clavipes]